MKRKKNIGESVCQHGEEGDVNTEEIKEMIQEINKILEEHDPEFVYNWDETGL